MAGCDSGLTCPGGVCLGVLAWVSCGRILQGDWAPGYFAEAFDFDAHHYYPVAAHRSKVRPDRGRARSLSCCSDSANYQLMACHSPCKCFHSGYLRRITLILPGGSSDGSCDPGCFLLDRWSESISTTRNHCPGGRAQLSRYFVVD